NLNQFDGELDCEIETAATAHGAGHSARRRFSTPSRQKRARWGPRIAGQNHVPQVITQQPPAIDGTMEMVSPSFSTVASFSRLGLFFVVNLDVDERAHFAVLGIERPLQMGMLRTRPRRGLAHGLSRDM